MELEIFLQLVLVVWIEQEILLLTGQGLQGTIIGPKESDRGVDGIGDQIQQAQVLEQGGW